MNNNSTNPTSPSISPSISPPIVFALTQQHIDDGDSYSDSCSIALAFKDVYKHIIPWRYVDGVLNVDASIDARVSVSPYDLTINIQTLIHDEGYNDNSNDNSSDAIVVQRNVDTFLNPFREQGCLVTTKVHRFNGQRWLCQSMTITLDESMVQRKTLSDGSVMQTINPITSPCTLVITKGMLSIASTTCT